MIRIAHPLALVLLAAPAAAWDGSDSATGNPVEIGKGQAVRSGRDVEFYDYGSGSYRTIDVDTVRRRGGSVEVEGVDGEGNSVTLEMDGSGE